jgi:uncharacterized protein YcfL
MKNIVVLVFASFLSSCAKKIEQKVFTDGNIIVKTYTIERGDVQSANPNKSYVEVRRGLQSEMPLVYDSYGINSVSVKFKNKTILIKGNDEQTIDLIKNAHIKKADVFGYRIVK